MMRTYGNIALAASIALALTGCSKDEAPPPQLAPAPEMTQTQNDQPTLKAEDLEHSTLDAQAPFVLKLETTATKGQTGPIELTARIDAPHTIDAPTSIELKLPDGAALLEGTKRETLADLPGGVTTRTFKVDVTKALSPSNPIEVAVHMQHPGGAFGAHARRQFPKELVQTPLSPSKVPAPPVGRPGGMKPPAGTRAMPGR